MKVSWYAAGALLLAMIARAGIITYNAVLVNTPALAYNNTYSVNLQTNGIGTLSAQAYYSTATVADATFVDGTQSTGGFTILDYTALSTAAAHNSITVLSTSDLSGATIVVPGFVLVNGQDWATQPTTSQTALSIKNALANVPYLSVSVSGSVVYATATAKGSLYNSYGLVSTSGNLSVATPQFTGGQDNAVIRINGVALQQAINWTAGSSNAQAATSLAAAINASSLNTALHASASGSVVTATSTLNGSKYNYLLQTSTPTALASSGSNMAGGTTPNFTLNSPVFTGINGSGLTTALALLYTGSPAIGGLSSGTTYYSVPVSGDSFMLAKYSTSAVAGNVDLVIVTSTNTQLSADTYTLAPLKVTGNASFKWQVSNDNSTWTDIAVSSVTVTPTSSANSTIWSFGFIGTQYLRINVIAPTTGALALKIQLIGTN